MLERFAKATDQLGFVPHHRHMTDGAFVLDCRRGRGMIDRFPAHPRNPIGIAPCMGHHAGSPMGTDRDVLTPRGGDSVVAGDTAVGGLKMRAEALGVRGFLTANFLVRRGWLGSRFQRGKRGCHSQQEEWSPTLVPGDSHLQPCLRVPST